VCTLLHSHEREASQTKGVQERLPVTSLPDQITDHLLSDERLQDSTVDVSTEEMSPPSQVVSHDDPASPEQSFKLTLVLSNDSSDDMLPDLSEVESHDTLADQSQGVSQVESFDQSHDQMESTEEGPSGDVQLISESLITFR